MTRGIDRVADVLGDPLVEALSTTTNGAFVTDGAGRIVLWNAAAEAILGYSPAEALGRPIGTLLRGDASSRNRGGPGSPVRAPSADPASGFDMQARSKAGGGVWIGVLTLVLAHAGTGASFVVHLFRDIDSLRDRLAIPDDAADTAATNGRATPLTRREQEILTLMGDGLNTASMARRLHLSRATIRNHVQNIFLKLDVHSRLEAVALGRRHRLL